MVHHNDLSDHNERPAALSRSLTDIIYPVVTSQVYMVKNPATGITWQNQSMVVATDERADF